MYYITLTRSNCNRSKGRRQAAEAEEAEAEETEKSNSAYQQSTTGLPHQNFALESC
jgi:hypothetical protein